MKSVIRGAIMGAATAAALVGVMVAPARASNTYDDSGFSGTGLGPGYVQADWESNSNPVLVMQTRVQCHPSLGGNEYYEYSGNVESLELNDTATCLFAGIADHGWIRFKSDVPGSSWGSWHSFWTRCCTRNKP